VIEKLYCIPALDFDRPFGYIEQTNRLAQLPVFLDRIIP